MYFKRVRFSIGASCWTARSPVRRPKGGGALLFVIARFPQISAIPAYVMGIGVLPEHAPPFARRSASREI